MKAHIFEQNINHKQTRYRACIILRNKTRIHLDADKMEKALLSIIIFFIRDNNIELKVHKKKQTTNNEAQQ